jgi:hypothetical protein
MIEARTGSVLDRSVALVHDDLHILVERSVDFALLAVGVAGSKMLFKMPDARVNGFEYIMWLGACAGDVDAQGPLNEAALIVERLSSDGDLVLEGVMQGVNIFNGGIKLLPDSLDLIVETGNERAIRLKWYAIVDLRQLLLNLLKTFLETSEVWAISEVDNDLLELVDFVAQLRRLAANVLDDLPCVSERFDDVLARDEVLIIDIVGSRLIFTFRQATAIAIHAGEVALWKA